MLDQTESLLNIVAHKMTLKDSFALEGHSLLKVEPQKHLVVPSLQTSLKILAHRTTLKYPIGHHHLDE